MSLKINDFAVIARNIVDVGKLEEPFSSDAIIDALQGIAAQSSENFGVIEDISSRVCSLAKKDIARIELPTIDVLDIPKLYYMKEQKVLDAFEKNPTYSLFLHLALHRSGVLIVNFHRRVQKEEGISVEDAIEDIRFNLHTIAVKIPKKLCLGISAIDEDRCRIFSNEKKHFFVGTLKDFASLIIRPLIISELTKKFEIAPMRERRCISSTLTQIYQTTPPCESIEQFLTPEKYGKEIFGLATMDRAYVTRSESAVSEGFSANLSTDEETGVFTFVLSDLIIFDHSFNIVINEACQEKSFQDRYSAILYYSTHYSCLLEWVYLEKYLIDLYNRMLSRTAARPDTAPEEMLRLQKQSMHDLIGYKSGITPYPSREDFWEKARVNHRIPEAQEKMEKKRDLATDYVLQEYTLRTNRSIQLVNIFISATAAFGLMEVILSIFQGGSNKALWGGITALLFIGMLGVLWGMNKAFQAITRKKY